MARYSDFRYSTREYGQAPRSSALSLIEAKALDFGVVVVTVDASNRFGSNYVIVRSENGAAEDPTDGLTVASGRIETTLFQVFDDAPAGVIYYTLFVFDANGQWLKDAATSVLAPQDRRGYLKTLQSVPRMFLADDLNPLAPFSTDTFLAKFLYGVALTVDELGTYTDLVLPESRSGQGIRRMSHAWAAGLGFNPEVEIGTAASYRLARDCGLIYTQKGTKTGLVAYAEALTGWSVTLSRYENLLPTLDDASFETSSGGWGIEGADFTVAEPDEGDNPLYELPYDYPLSRFARQGTGRFFMTGDDAVLTLPAEPAVGSLIPAQEFRLYVFKVPARATHGSPDLTISIVWYDNRGNAIDTLSSSPEVLGEEATEFTVISVSGQAPEGTRFMGLRIDASGAENYEFDLDRLSLMDADGPYRDPNTVTLICGPDRVNLLSDPSFEEEGFWEAETGTLSINETAAVQGDFGAEVTGEPYSLVSESIPALPEFSLTLSAQMRGTGTSSLGLEYYDSAGNVVDYDFVEVSLGDDFQTVNHISVVPEGAETLRLAVRGSGTAFLDLLSIDRQERPQSYFDGTISNVNQDDSRFAFYDGHVYSLLYNNRLTKLVRLKKSLEDYLPIGVSARVVLWDSDDDEVQKILPYGVDLDALPPDAPQNLFALPGDERIFVSFTPGESEEPIRNYSYSLDNGRTWIDRRPSSTASEFTIFGTPATDLGTERRITYAELDGYVDYADLAENFDNYFTLAGLVDVPLNAIVNGRTYYVRVRAVTDEGYGTPSNVVVVTPQGLPGKPTIFTVIEEDQQALVYFNPGLDNGANVDSFQYSLDGGGTWDLVDGDQPLVLSGLTNGQEYSIIVRANSDAGNSDPSDPYLFTPFTTSGAPDITAAVPGNETVELQFTPPEDDGGRPVENYEFSVNDGLEWNVIDPPVTTSPILVQGLTIGQEYNFRLRAITERGAGQESNAVSAIPVRAPDAPTITSIAASDQALSVFFRLNNEGGTPVTNVEVTTDNGSTWISRDPASATSPITVTGLENGTDYQMRVRSTNAVGTGAQSGAVIGRPVSIPNPPQDVSASPDSELVSLSWEAPENDGGTPVDYYLVQVQPDTGTVTYPLDRSETGAVVSGLTNGTPYNFTVTAVNRAGLVGPGGTATATPRTTPSAPGSVVGSRGDRSVTLTWTPGFDGGSAVTNYRVRYSSNAGTSWSPGELTGSTATAFTVTGLTAGTPYVFQVRAVNVAGESSYSQASAPVVPAEPAMPPNNLTVVQDPIVTVTGAVSTTSVLLVEWELPSNAELAAITDYVIETSSDSGNTWNRVDSTSSLQYRITGLPNGVPVEVRVAARGLAGLGSFEESDPITPANRPTAPVITTASTGDGTITVYFTASGNGSPVTNVQYSLSTKAGDRTVWEDFNPQTISSPATIQGVTNNVRYYVSLRAINAVGTGPASAQVVAVAQGLPGAPTITAFSSQTTSNIQFSYHPLYRYTLTTTTTVSFTPPSSNGGSPITGYDISIDNGSSVWRSTTSTTSPVTFYQVGVGGGRLIRMRAKTAIGVGPWSAPFAYN